MLGQFRTRAFIAPPGSHGHYSSLGSVKTVIADTSLVCTVSPSARLWSIGVGALLGPGLCIAYSCQLLPTEFAESTLVQMVLAVVVLTSFCGLHGSLRFYRSVTFSPADGILQFFSRGAPRLTETYSLAEIKSLNVFTQQFTRNDRRSRQTVTTYGIRIVFEDGGVVTVFQTSGKLDVSQFISRFRQVFEASEFAIQAESPEAALACPGSL